MDENLKKEFKRFSELISMGLQAYHYKLGLVVDECIPKYTKDLTNMVEMSMLSASEKNAAVFQKSMEGFEEAKSAFEDSTTTGADCDAKHWTMLNEALMACMNCKRLCVPMVEWTEYLGRYSAAEAAYFEMIAVKRV